MESSITKTVGQGTAWLAISTLFLKSVGFVTIFIILNHLTVFEYGVAELVQTAVPLLSLLLLPGLGATVIADMARERGARDLARMRGLLFSYVRLQYVFAIVAWAIVFFGAQALATWFGKGSTVLYFQTVSFLFLLSPVRSAVQTTQAVFLEFRQQALYSFLEEMWKLALLITFFFAFSLRIEGLLFAVVLAQALALVSIMYPLYKIDPVFWRTPGQRFPTFYFLHHHGKWGVFSNYLGTFSKNIRPWIITIFLGPSAVGIYAVAQGLIGHVVSLVPLDAVVKPLLPQYIHAKERFYTLVAKAIKYELLGYVLVSTASAVAVPFLVAWFFPQYTSAVSLFQIMLIMLASTAFDTIFTGVFLAIQAQRSLFWATSYKLLLTMVLMPPFLHIFGLFGIAYAVIMVNYLYVWERYLKLKRLMPGFSLRMRDFVSLDEYDHLIIKKLTQSFLKIVRI